MSANDLATKKYMNYTNFSSALCFRY